MSELTPLAVGCPDCGAGPDVACHTSGQGTFTGTDAVHAARRDSARLRSVEHGTCTACGQWMVRGYQDEGGPLTAWHPDTAHAAVCPPMADPGTDWNTHAAQINTGLTPGHPGLECFQLAASELDAKVDALHGPGAAAAIDAAYADGSLYGEFTCPECQADKCRNCNGQAWDTMADQLTTCACTNPEHLERAPE